MPSVLWLDHSSCFWTNFKGFSGAQGTTKTSDFKFVEKRKSEKAYMVAFKTHMVGRCWMLLSVIQSLKDKAGKLVENVNH